MKIQNSTINNNVRINEPEIKSQPSFKSAAGVLGLSGGIMQGIENGGFLVSFLIQDALGMTAPRTYAGFLRDRDVTGEYNMQEGFEVLGREGLTGPCMMAVAPIMFLIAAKFGKTTSVNTNLIRRFGDNFKKLITKPDFDKTLLKNKDKFKEVFYRDNISQMLNNTLGKEHVNDDIINKILKEIKTYETPKTKGKVKKECIANITNYINEIKYSTSDELKVLGKLKVGEDKMSFSTKDAIDAMIKYSDDAISLNKNLEKLNEAAAEEIKDRSVAKRMITNISTMFATLGVLSVLPKIYAKSSVAPGAKTAMMMKEQEEKQESKGEVSFKGGKKSALGKLGKWISKHTNENWASELEYNGHNFTNTLMAGLSIFGLLAPRGYRAVSRAQKDENGKKDYTELYEILIRDLTSALSVVFAVPILTRLCVSSYENKSGFVLMNRDRTLSHGKKILDLINPYSKSHVLTNTEISSLYNNINSTDKMVNFCKYIEKNGGDLEKILSKSDNINEIYNLSELSGLSKAEKNKKIVSFFENFAKGNDKKALNEKITKLMTSAKAGKASKITAFARGLNSVPGLIATFLISPAILGWFIPRLTYANTRRLHEKERKAKLNAAV